MKFIYKLCIRQIYRNNKNFWFGCNDNGELGINITNVNISGIKTVYCKDRIIKINSGVSHGCFITDKSEAYFFGNNKYEQCLNVSNDTLYKPYKVK